MTDPVQNPYISAESVGKDGNGESLAVMSKRGMIVTAALAQGVAFITAIMLFLMRDEQQPANGETAGNGDLVLPAIGIAAALGACVFSYFLSGMIKRTAISKFQTHEQNPERPSSEDESLTPAVHQLMNASQASTIVGQAILEGAAIMNAILMMIDGNLLHLAPIAVLMIGILMLTPTLTKKWALIDEAFGQR